MDATPHGTKYAPHQVIDADFVVYRLEEAGATLLALPGNGMDNAAAQFVAGDRAHSAGGLWLDRVTHTPASPFGRENQPHG